MPAAQLEAPEFGQGQFGGVINPGYQLNITRPSGLGTVYYSLDGTDPRLLGGAINTDPPGRGPNRMATNSAYITKALSDAGVTDRAGLAARHEAFQQRRALEQQVAEAAAELDLVARSESELAVVEEGHAGGGEHAEGAHPVAVAQRRGGAGLVVVLHEAHRPVAVGRAEAGPHAGGVAGHEPVVELLVVAGVEALREQLALAAPVGLGQGHDVGVLGPGRAEHCSGAARDL